ncbi:MAG: hypothetical protein CL609_11715 [Anaerolineaceae bacterium]|nr:hypothetical protein [Anaerolineaceae bacterium]
MTPKKFLSVIAGFILVSGLVAILLFMVRDRLPQYRDDDTPAAVVSNYLTAILREDYETAYDYLGEWPEKPDYAVFLDRVNGLTGYQFCVEIPEYPRADVETKTPTTVYIESYQCDSEWQVDWETYDKVQMEPYIGPNEARLKEVAGSWKIEQMPLPWWDEAWLPINTDKE